MTAGPGSGRTQLRVGGPAVTLATMTDQPYATSLPQTGRSCVIAAAGEYYPDTPPALPSDALVIAADGGLNHCEALGITPDVIVGDFDSVRGPVPQTTRTIALPALKDDPDLLSALKVGWQAGARTFHICGALGGRIDHTLANVQLLAAVASHGGIAWLYGDRTVVTVIQDGALTFDAASVAPERMVSVFSHADESRGVSETGLKYELHDAVMRNSEVIGVSNEFLPHTTARIAVEDGSLIVTFPAEAGLPAVERFHAFTGDLGPLDTAVSPLLNTAFR